MLDSITEHRQLQSTHGIPPERMASPGLQVGFVEPLRDSLSPTVERSPVGDGRLTLPGSVSGSEVALLHPDKAQTWPNGGMRCDFCEGYFNGWRGF